MKKNGKTLVLFALMTACLFLSSCNHNNEEQEASNYKITTPKGLESTVKIDAEANTITLEPPTPAENENGTEYTISGTFYGQIINKTKGTKIILDNEHLKNTQEKQPFIVM